MKKGSGIERRCDKCKKFSSDCKVICPLCMTSYHICDGND